jgi:hypothetical protein
MKALIACLIGALAFACIWLHESNKEKNKKITELQEQTAKDHNEITAAYDKLVKHQSGVNNHDALIRCLADAENDAQDLLHNSAVAMRKDGSITVPVPVIIEARQRKDSEIADCKLLYGGTH